MEKTSCISLILCCFLLLFSCQGEEDMQQNDTGYLRLEVAAITSVSTKSSVPENYNPKQLCVEIKNEAGTIVESTKNHTEWEGKQFKLKAGSYTITASSNGFDGNASGVDIPYYKGSVQVTVEQGKEVTAEVICKLANVKVTVNFDESFTNSFKSAVVLIESKVAGISGQNLMMGVQNKSVYFPEGDLKATITVINKENKSNTLSQDFTKVKARDHYILNYKIAESGSGDITVGVDETEKAYTYDIKVPVKSTTSLVARTANAWSNFTYLEGFIASSESELDPSFMKFEYKKKNEVEWNELAAIRDKEDLFKATLKNLEPNTTYSYRLSYRKDNDVFVSDIIDFTTEVAIPLSNGSFDDWYSSGKIWYATTEAEKYWDSSNPGCATYIGSITTGDGSVVHTIGGKSAKLESKYAVVKFAAASLYTGQFQGLVGTKGAKLRFGQPFAARPTSLHGWLRYAPGVINRVSNVPAGVTVVKNETIDTCSVYIALATRSYDVDNTNMSTFPDYETDPGIVAYGQLALSDCVDTNGSWKEFNIDLIYHDLTKKPTHIIIVCSSSKYGDYFTGSDKSVLYLDDFELIYGDEPKTK